MGEFFAGTEALYAVREIRVEGVGIGDVLQGSQEPLDLYKGRVMVGTLKTSEGTRRDAAARTQT